MNNLPLFALTAFVSALVCSTSYADIYKWKDNEGKLRYSDVPPKSDTQYQVLNKKRPSKASDVSSVDKNSAVLKPPQILTMETKNAKEASGMDIKKLNSTKEQAEKLKITQFQQNENVAIDAENCQSAKSNLATYKNGGRIKRVNEKGETSFLNDADIAASVKSAQADIEKYCHG